MKAILDMLKGILHIDPFANVFSCGGGGDGGGGGMSAAAAASEGELTGEGPIGESMSGHEAAYGGSAVTGISSPGAVAGTGPEGEIFGGHEPESAQQQSQLPWSAVMTLMGIHPALGIVGLIAKGGEALGLSGGEEPVGDQVGPGDISESTIPGVKPKKAAPSPVIPPPVTVIPPVPESQAEEAAENERRKARRMVGRMAMRKARKGTEAPVYIPTLL
jgi:hypothetical protein